MPDNWDEIRSVIIRRHRNHCLRCDKKFNKADLSVHHLIPRDLGGSNEPSNLVALCVPCHDIVEIEGCKTIAEIIGSYSEPVVSYKAKKKCKSKSGSEKHKGETFSRPSWHKIVYGGHRDDL